MKTLERSLKTPDVITICKEKQKRPWWKIWPRKRCGTTQSVNEMLHKGHMLAGLEVERLSEVWNWCETCEKYTWQARVE